MGERVITLTINDENNGWEAYTLIEEHLMHFYNIGLQDVSEEELAKMVIHLLGYVDYGFKENLFDDILESHVPVRKATRW